MTKAPADAYCPHCELLLDRGVGEPWPAEPVRCPHCRLVVGTGRARSAPTGEPGARGTAAGVFSRQARREDSEDAAPPDEILAGIRAAAAQIGERPDRLLMLDYQARSLEDPELPPLRDVRRRVRSWKRARREAGELGHVPARVSARQDSIDQGDR